MANSGVDRVFVHAINTVQKIPRTGSARPPTADRLRLYGLYKQATEGEVDGVMERPGGHNGYAKDEDTLREQQKWDAWDAQKGLSMGEAKRRYIEALIETMRRYASTTSDSRELLSELEFVWSQVSKNYPSSNDSPPRDDSSSQQRRFAAPRSGTEGPMKVLYPMSEESEGIVESEAGSEDNDDDNNQPANWKGKVENTLVKMTAEMAALREQISNGREWRNKRRRTISSWIKWVLWSGFKLAVADVFLLLLVLLWMRKRRDRRLEDLVREYLRLARSWVSRYLPARPPLAAVSSATTAVSNAMHGAIKK